MSERDEYDLRKSTDKIGELYPVIMSATGEVVDGFHRINAKANWRREVREDIDTPEKVLLARLISNKFRRQVEASEVRGWINDLAQIAVDDHGIEPGQISGWVAEQTGYHPSSVMRYLDEKYKQMRESKYKGPPDNIKSSKLEEAKSLVTEEIGITIDLDTANGLTKAAKALEREAKRKIKEQKTPEQLEAEKADKLRKKQEKTEKARQKKLDAERKQKELEEKLRIAAEAKVNADVELKAKEEAKQELAQDPEFIKEVKRTIIKPPIPAPRENQPSLKTVDLTEKRILLMVYISRELNAKLEDYCLKNNSMKEEAIETLLWEALDVN